MTDDIQTFTVNFTPTEGLSVSPPERIEEPAPHPNLEGMKPGDYWAVVEHSKKGSFYWGPYATKNAAQSVVEERGIGHVVHLSQI